MLKQNSTSRAKPTEKGVAALRSGSGLGRRPLALAALVGALAIIAAACSSSPSASSTSTTNGGSSPTSSGSGSVALASATAGSLGSVLTGPNGRTLYELTTEHNGSIDCTGSCVSTWPPLTVTSGQTAKVSGSLSGALGTAHRPEGTTQVTYNGHPVYYYSGDSAAGQANGQGVGGVWFALTPSGTAATSGAGTTPSTSGATTTPSTSGGYSY